MSKIAKYNLDKEIQKAIVFLKKKDSVLSSIIDKVGVYHLTPKDDYFTVLCDSIISQQLSMKAADSILKRFFDLVGTVKPLPIDILKFEVEDFRSIGCSNAKGRYILDLASKVDTNELNLHSLNKLSNDEIIAELTKVKGIGKWTAEMFLMFSLCRLDVFPIDDLGIKNSLIKNYNFPPEITKKQMIEFGDKFAPYQTIAAWYLWKSLNNEPKV